MLSMDLLQPELYCSPIYARHTAQYPRYSNHLFQYMQSNGRVMDNQVWTHWLIYLLLSFIHHRQEQLCMLPFHDRQMV